VFSDTLRPSSDKGMHNFKIRTIVEVKLQMRKYKHFSKRKIEKMRKKIKDLLAARYIEPSNNL
jgi:hypothetical protein